MGALKWLNIIMDSSIFFLGCFVSVCFLAAFHHQAFYIKRAEWTMSAYCTTEFFAFAVQISTLWLFNFLIAKAIPEWWNVLVVKCKTVRPTVINYDWFDLVRYSFQEFRLIIVLQFLTSYFLGFVRRYQDVQLIVTHSSLPWQHRRRKFTLK
jgi:hypothetical protein